ncbi:hypothetical protein ASPWEDRAFT_75263, partial [Aspergillus wentii DTO 134E9]
MPTPNYFQALDSATSRTKFTTEVQTAASGINKETLQTAVEIALSADDKTASLDEEQAAALEAGFTFATALVKMLGREPVSDEKLVLYGYFKRARNEEPVKPAGYQFEAKFKYAAWKKVGHITEQKAQVEYIKQVDILIDKYGT